MSNALQGNTMQIAPEVDESSCRTEQNLPGLKGAAESQRATEQRETASASRANRSANLPDATTGLAAMVENHANHRDSSTQPGTTAVRATVGEAVARAIENTVMSLRHTNEASLAVVVRPDGNTQLSLHFKLQHGHCEALAVLERGDFKSLSSEWAQLQGRLADQGIRLAPLVAEARISMSGGGHFASSRQQQDDPSFADLQPPRTASSPARKSDGPGKRHTTEREWWA